MEIFYVLTLFIGLAVYVVCDRHMGKKAVCEIDKNTGMPDYLMEGKITFTQKPGENVTIHVELSGFNTTDDKSLHGFHVHDKGNITDGCKAAEGHFNPSGVVHGGPTDTIRHVGDLGNIDENGMSEINITFTDHIIQLEGNYSIIGRTIVVHETEDDLGKVDNDGSRATGNAGGRIGCCLIVEAMYDDSHSGEDMSTDSGEDMSTDSREDMNTDSGVDISTPGMVNDDNAAGCIKNFTFLIIAGLLAVLFCHH